jgi:hypothetical protein
MVGQGRHRAETEQWAATLQQLSSQAQIWVLPQPDKVVAREVVRPSLWQDLLVLWALAMASHPADLGQATKSSHKSPLYIFPKESTLLLAAI